MKNYTAYPVFASLLVGLATAVYGADADIQPVKKRERVLDQAHQLAKTAAPEAAVPPDNLRNPFTPAPVEEVRTARPTSDKDLLLILADQLHPTGVIGREDALMLLLKGQKGVKVNEKLTLSFDGAMYDVEVIAVNNTSFSLRYNQTEITRPINKTGKNP